MALKLRPRTVPWQPARFRNNLAGHPAGHARRHRVSSLEGESLAEVGRISMDDGRYGSDALLVEGLRNREVEAEEVFVNRYLPLIIATLRRIMTPEKGTEPADLQDLSIDIAERLIRRVAGTRPVTNLRALVAKTAFNAGIDWYRREKRRRERQWDGDVADISPSDIHNDARDDPEVRNAAYVPINPEAATVFARALATLTEEDRRLLQLRASGTSYDEIALMLRDDAKPVKAVTWRKRHERAYQKLLTSCRTFADGTPDLLRHLEEAQKQARGTNRPTSSEAT